MSGRFDYPEVFLSDFQNVAFGEKDIDAAFKVFRIFSAHENAGAQAFFQFDAGVSMIVVIMCGENSSDVKPVFFYLGLDFSAS